jgi:hypothetical protein
MGFPHLENVLLPRVKAFELAVRELSEQGVDDLYDVTILYPDETKFALEPYNISNLFALIPRSYNVHFVVKHFSLQQEKLTSEATFEEIRDWLYRLYVRKDRLVGKWKQHGDKALDDALRDFDQSNPGVGTAIELTAGESQLGVGNQTEVCASDSNKCMSIDSAYTCRQEAGSVSELLLQAAPYPLVLMGLATLLYLVIN